MWKLFRPEGVLPKGLSSANGSPGCNSMLYICAWVAQHEREVTDIDVNTTSGVCTYHHNVTRAASKKSIQLMVLGLEAWLV